MAVHFENLGNELSFLEEYKVDGYSSFDGEFNGSAILFVYLSFIKTDPRYSYAMQFLKTK